MDSFKDYQAKAQETAVYQQAIQQLSSDNAYKLLRLGYTALGLAGEAGELSNKVKKLVRGDTTLSNQFTKASIMMAAGDVLWYVAAMASELGYSLDEVAQMNVDKLAGRQADDTLKGNGDER